MPFALQHHCRRLRIRWEVRDDMHEVLHGLAAQSGLLHEWLQGTYLAVDLPPGTEPAPFIKTLEHPAEPGALHWEIDA